MGLLLIRLKKTNVNIRNRKRLTATKISPKYHSFGLTLLSVVVGLLFLPGHSLAQGFNTFSGQVTNQNGQPIVGITIGIVNSDGTSSAQGVTDSNGNYSFQTPATVFNKIAAYWNQSPPPGTSNFFISSLGTFDLTNGNLSQNLQINEVPLTVTVEDGNGNPLPSIPVNALQSGSYTTSSFAFVAGSNAPVTVSAGLITGTTDSTGSVTFIVPGGTVYSQDFGQTNPQDNIQAQLPSLNLYLAAPITVNSATSVIIRLLISILPPSNLIATTTTNQSPALSWDVVVNASSYNVYRIGTKIGSTTSTSYSDTTSSEGNNTYYVTAVNAGGESGPSNTVTVLVDRTAPSITYTVSTIPNSNAWNNSSVVVTFSCSDNTGGSGLATCTSPVTLSQDGVYAITGIATDNAGNTTSINVTIKLDTTSPTVSSPVWSVNPVVAGNSTNLAVTVSDNLSGVASGEYYIGTTDPGVGNGISMTLSGSILTTSLGSSLSPGSYQVNVRAKDAAGNWSSVVSTTLVVNSPVVAPTITSQSTYSIGIRQFITATNLTITTSGTTPTITEHGTLPTGLTFSDNGNGTANFMGMIASGTEGTYNITITASNSAGTVTQNFTLTITNASSAPTTIFTSSNNITLVHAVSMTPVTFTATGNGKNFKIFLYGGKLPTGLSLHDNKDGTASLFGTPTTPGVYTFTIEASDSLGTVLHQFTITVL